MNRKESYLSERVYMGKKEKVDVERYNYWKNLLGEKCVQYLCVNDNFEGYFRNDDYYSIEEVDTRKILEYLNRNNREEKTKKYYFEKNILFDTFYTVFINYGIQQLQKNIQGVKKVYRETVFADFGQYLAEQLQTVSMRTLIVEMHKYQSMGKLLGENSEEEYQYFCSHIIGEISNIKKLFKEYPVLCRCIEEKITACVNFYKNIIGQFFEDEEEIEERLCLMQKGLHIVHIESSHSCKRYYKS